MKRLGVYIAFAPGISLRGEGIARYLSAFMQAAGELGVSLVIGCPSWSRKELRKLCTGIPASSYQFVGPAKTPALFKVRVIRRFIVHAAAKDPRRYRGAMWRAATPALALAALSCALRNPVLVFMTLWTALIAAAVTSPVVAVLALRLRAVRRVGRRNRPRNTDRVYALNGANVASWIAQRLYQREIRLLLRHLGAQRDVLGWYCPTASWPSFNKIPHRKRLTCVPDIWTVSFPASAEAVSSDAVTCGVRQTRRTIKGGIRFVTYSEHTRQQALLAMLNVGFDQVHVVRHAPMDLRRSVDFLKATDTEAISRNYCYRLIEKALFKTKFGATPSMATAKFKFLFFASQFRPSKNILTLVRAYAYLLRTRLVEHKLVLTGSLSQAPELAELIAREGLEMDVLVLHQLDEQQLAACYKLADVAVNPSLSEGGMPFTFTEALSMGTPTVMGDIAVTREIITDENLRSRMLFDPYDWRAVAERIEWAVANRAALLAEQRRFFEDNLAQRTWQHVVQEHMSILEGMPERREV